MVQRSKEMLETQVSGALDTPKTGTHAPGTGMISPSIRSKSSTHRTGGKVTTYVRREPGHTHEYIDMMVTPYADPLTLEDIDEMRFTPPGERRDEQPGCWGKFAAVLLNPHAANRWNRMISNLRNIHRTGLYVAKQEDQSLYMRSRMGRKKTRKYTRHETVPENHRSSRRFDSTFGVLKSAYGSTREQPRVMESSSRVKPSDDTPGRPSRRMSGGEIEPIDELEQIEGHGNLHEAIRFINDTEGRTYTTEYQRRQSDDTLSPIAFDRYETGVRSFDSSGIKRKVISQKINHQRLVKFFQSSKYDKLVKKKGLLSQKQILEQLENFEQDEQKDPVEYKQFTNVSMNIAKQTPQKLLDFQTKRKKRILSQLMTMSSVNINLESTARIQQHSSTKSSMRYLPEVVTTAPTEEKKFRDSGSGFLLPLGYKSSLPATPIFSGPTRDSSMRAIMASSADLESEKPAAPLRSSRQKSRAPSLLSKHKRIASLHYTAAEICKNLEESLQGYMKNKRPQTRGQSRGQKEAQMRLKSGPNSAMWRDVSFLSF